MKNKIKLLVFDGYGVVMTRGYPDTEAVLARRFGLPVKKLHEVIYTKYFNMAAERKITQKQAWQFPVKELNLPITWQELAKIHLDLLNIRPQELRFVQSLKKKYQTLMLSKNTRSQFAYTRKKLPQAWKAFNHVINTWELGLPKASRQTISLVAKRFTVKPSEMLYVDDQASNLAKPRKMGVTTILYRNYHQFKRDVLKVLK